MRQWTEIQEVLCELFLITDTQCLAESLFLGLPAQGKLILQFQMRNIRWWSCWGFFSLTHVTAGRRQAELRQV